MLPVRDEVIVAGVHVYVTCLKAFAPLIIKICLQSMESRKKTQKETETDRPIESKPDR